MHDDNNKQMTDRNNSKQSAQVSFRKNGCASIILLIILAPFLYLGGSQLIDTISVSNRHESKLAMKYLQNKYGEEFKVVRGTVNYNTPLQTIRLKAFAEAEPDIIFSAKVSLGGEERYYWDDHIVQRGFDRIISYYLNKDEFFYEVSLESEEDFEKSTHSQEQKRNNDYWAEYLDLFENIHFNISIYTYWSSDPVVNDAKLKDLNSFIQVLKKYSLNDYKIYLKYDINNTEGDKGEFDRLVEYLRKNEKQIKVKKTEKLEYESCGILLNAINSKEDLHDFISGNCSIIESSFKGL